jgi:putative membrane protein
MNLLHPRWLDEGQDPDYRYSLANERTFLAWIRTSLSLIAAAVAVVQLVPAFRVSGAREVLGVILAACGVGAATLAYVRWSGNERAMRTGTALPFTRALFLLATTLTVIGVVVLLLALFGSR